MGPATGAEGAFGDRLRPDPERTRAARGAWVRGGAEACACQACRAWLDAREALVSPELHAFLSGLGLDAARDSAVRRLEPDDEVGDGYELLYHLCGVLETDGECDATGPLPAGVLALSLCQGSELAPPGWASDAALELRVWVPAGDEA